MCPNHKRWTSKDLKGIVKSNQECNVVGLSIFHEFWSEDKYEPQVDAENGQQEHAGHQVEVGLK